MGGVTYFQYDAAGNRTVLLDAEEHPTYFEYDAVGRQTSETDAMGNARSSKTGQARCVPCVCLVSPKPKGGPNSDHLCHIRFQKHACDGITTRSGSAADLHAVDDDTILFAPGVQRDKRVVDTQ